MALARGLGYLVLGAMGSLLLATLCPGTARGQALPPVTRVVVTRQAASTLDSLASKSRDERVETAACVTSYTVRDSLLTIERLGPATYLRADSTSIVTDSTRFAPICAVGTPSVHSHVAFGGYPVPSDQDSATQARMGVWCVLLSVLDTGWRILVYGRRGETP